MNKGSSINKFVYQEKENRKSVADTNTIHIRSVSLLASVK